MLERKSYTIDAAGRVLGRLAVQISGLLRGKQKPNFFPYKDMGDRVLVKNVSKLVVTGKKMEQKLYRHHTLYLGGLKSATMKKVFDMSPDKVLRKAVFGMMPKNKLRDKQIRRLKIEK